MGRTVTIPNSRKHDDHQDDCVNTDGKLKIVFAATGNLSLNNTSGDVPDFPKGRHKKGYKETHDAPHASGGEIDWTFVQDNGSQTTGTLTVHENDADCEDPKKKKKHSARKPAAKRKK